MGYSENMVLLDKLDFGELVGIMRGLLRVPSEERVSKRDKR